MPTNFQAFFSVFAAALLLFAHWGSRADAQEPVGDEREKAALFKGYLEDVKKGLAAAKSVDRIDERTRKALFECLNYDKGAKEMVPIVRDILEKLLNAKAGHRCLAALQGQQNNKSESHRTCLLVQFLGRHGGEGQLELLCKCVESPWNVGYESASGLNGTYFGCK